MGCPDCGHGHRRGGDRFHGYEQHQDCRGYCWHRHHYGSDCEVHGFLKFVIFWRRLTRLRNVRVRTSRGDVVRVLFRHPHRSSREMFINLVAFASLIDCEETMRKRTLCRNWIDLARQFVFSESAVVTVEWVALAAGLTVGAIAISFIVMNGLVAPAHNIASQLSP